ncbi:hypothetical protein [Halalkalibacter lacteus]|uniref:hypothetical protein n=1 Tax=Halalkalibacter lacteus TaxID=3090663 RepID=UPI002FCA94C3
MSWQQKIGHLFGQPVGVSFTDGQGTSGVLCSADGNQIYIMEYLYQSQFALKHYDYRMIQDINSFPHCQPHHNHYQPPLY